MSVDKVCFLEEQDLSLCRFWVPHLLPERAELLKSSWEEGLVIAMHVSFPCSEKQPEPETSSDKQLL